MTREEFVAIAAEAAIRQRGYDPEFAAPEVLAPFVELVTAALHRVGAWETRERLKTRRVWCVCDEDGTGHNLPPGRAICDRCHADAKALAIAEAK